MILHTELSCTANGLDVSIAFVHPCETRLLWTNSVELQFMYRITLNPLPSNAESLTHQSKGTMGPLQN